MASGGVRGAMRARGTKYQTSSRPSGSSCSESAGGSQLVLEPVSQQRSHILTMEKSVAEILDLSSQLWRFSSVSN